MKFKHGDRVTCEIEGIKITDARISINEAGTPYICQNKHDGGTRFLKDRLGYEYGWCLEDDFTDEEVSNLCLAKKTFEFPQIGDVYMDRRGTEKTVLGVAGRVIFLSRGVDKDFSDGSSYTKEELIKDGYTIKQDEPVEEITELTLEEIAEKFGKDVENIKIKK